MGWMQMGWIFVGWSIPLRSANLPAMTKPHNNPTRLRESYAARLWLFRNAAGVSQLELSELLKLDRTTVSQVERATRNLTIDLLEVFWRVLGACTVTPLSGTSTYQEAVAAPLALREALGQRLRAVRTRRGLTQERLGPQAGFDAKFIGRIERAEHTTALDQVQKLCEFLQIDDEELIEACLTDVFGTL